MVRHGESEGNRERRFTTTPDAPLTDLGREQAAQARPEQRPVVHDHSQNRAELNHDVERLGSLVTRTQPMADQDQMPGGRHGQKFRQTFDQPKQSGDEQAHDSACS